MPCARSPHWATPSDGRRPRQTSPRNSHSIPHPNSRPVGTPGPNRLASLRGGTIGSGALRRRRDEFCKCSLARSHGSRSAGRTRTQSQRPPNTRRIVGDNPVDAKIEPTSAILREDPKGPYVNLIAVRSVDKDKPWVKELLAAYHTPEIKAFVAERFKGSVLAGW